MTTEEIRKEAEDVVRPRDYLELKSFEKQEFRNAQLKLVKEFLLTKKIEGCTNTTIRFYHDNLVRLIDWTPKDLKDLTTKDIRSYLYYYQETHDVKESTLDGIRLVLSSFYRFLEDEEYILRNPVRRIHKIKHEQIVRLPFTDEELEIIRNGARSIRDLTIIDLLYSTGMRISEMTALDIKDVNFTKREIIVYGKGRRERAVWFNARTKVELLKYLETRTDDNPALFVHMRYPHDRLSKSGIRHMLKEIEDRTGVENIHPHRFRRTLATNLLAKGMTIEQVQQVLGHKKIETTLLYANVDSQMTRINHSKYTN